MTPNLPTGETMSEGSDLPPIPNEESGPGEQVVPLAFLSQPDDTEQMQTPEVGDKISMIVEATVTKIDGDNATVSPTSINGNNLDGSGEEQSPDDDEPQEDTEDSLRNIAQGMSSAPVTA